MRFLSSTRTGTRISSVLTWMTDAPGGWSCANAGSQTFVLHANTARISAPFRDAKNRIALLSFTGAVHAGVN
jgi:hypothetical protein